MEKKEHIDELDYWANCLRGPVHKAMEEFARNSEVKLGGTDMIAVITFVLAEYIDKSIKVGEMLAHKERGKNFFKRMRSDVSMMILTSGEENSDGLIKDQL